MVEVGVVLEKICMAETWAATNVFAADHSFPLRRHSWDSYSQPSHRFCLIPGHIAFFACSMPSQSPVAEATWQTIGRELIHNRCWNQLEVSWEGIKPEFSSLIPGGINRIAQTFKIARES